MSAQAKPVSIPDEETSKPAEGCTTASSDPVKIASKDVPVKTNLVNMNTVPTGNPAANDESSFTENNNLIKRSVDEICGLMGDVHEIREELLARGVQFHMLNALIELGVNERHEERLKMMGTALDASEKAFGAQAIKREELERYLTEIVTLEKDLRHVRHVASQQGIHMQALNHLTQLMRLNPGDGGVHAINTFVAYADAAGVPLDRMEKIREQFSDGPKSVLPNIARELEASRRESLLTFVSNLLIGTLLTAVVMWMVL